MQSRWGRIGTIVSIVVPLFVISQWGRIGVLARSLSGHIGTALCAPSPTSSARCSVWALQEFGENDDITSVQFNLTHTDPCVKEGISYHPLWIFLTNQLTLGPFLEINYALIRPSENGALEKDIITCCFQCPNIPAGQECIDHDIDLTPHGNDNAGWATIAYSHASHTYWWFYKGKTIRTIADSSLDYPFAMAVGGETNYWLNDMGIFSFERLRMFSKSQNSWMDFQPQIVGNNVGVGKRVVSGAGYGGRYLIGYRRHSFLPSTRPYVQVYSDHHISHSQDACGNTP